MKKRFAYTMVGALILAVAGAFASEYLTAASTQTTHEQLGKNRAPRLRKSTVAPATPIKKVSAGDKPLYGVMHSIYEGDGNFWDYQGAVQIGDVSCSHTKLGALTGGNLFCGVYFDGKYLQSYHNPNNGSNVSFIIYDATTWQPISGVMNYTNGGKPVVDMLPYALTYDHTSDRIYGCFFADGFDWWRPSVADAQFGYFDLSNALDPIRIVNRELPERFRAMATDKDGQLYGLAFSGKLYKVNKFTGEATDTGVEVELYSADGNPNDPFSSYGRESIAVDWETGDFYLAYSDDYDDSYIGKINPETGAFTKMAEYSWNAGDFYGDQFTGLFFIQEAEKKDDVVPAVVTDFNVEAVGTELKAAVTFTMPAVDVNGDALDTDLTWHVTNGASELGTGTAHSGEAVATTVDVPAEGNSSIVVYTTLGEQESAPVSKQVLFGEDEPEIWGLPEVDVNGKDVTITWYSAYAKNGGNLGEVTYKVTRMPDEVVVAEAATEPTFTDHIESDYKTCYTYVIEPKAGSKVGASVTSRVAWVGKYLSLPYYDDFTDGTRFLDYPFIDANGDGNIWEHASKLGGCAMYPANAEAADDYLLIGPFKMDAGTTYVFHMIADGHNPKEQIALYLGTDPEKVESFSTELVPPTILDPMKGETTIETAYEATETGDYYFGIKACTPYASQFIYVMEVSVKAIGATSPAAPSSFEITPGATTATLDCVLPATTVDGSKLEALTEARVYRDGTLIATATEGVAPGAEFTFVDEDPEVKKGFHNYTIAAVNAEGEGKPVTQQIYRGLDMPGRPTNLRLWEDLETPGLIHATFDHPKRGYYGGYVDPEEIYYVIDYLVWGTGSGVVEMGKGTDLTFQLPFKVNGQEIFAGSVYGRNTAGYVGKSGNWVTSVCYVGDPLTLPIQESWPGQTCKSGSWGGQGTNEDEELFGSFWNLSAGGITALRSQDGDGGMQALGTVYDGGGKRLLSPRFTTEGTNNPAIVFYYYYAPEAMDFALEVIVEDQPVRVLKQLDLDPANTGKWIREEVSLAEFKGTKYIQLAFSGHGKICEEYAAIDNVTISDLTNNDLRVLSFKAPAKVNANEELPLTVNFRNTGSKAVKAADYSIKFYKNGELFLEVPGQDIDADATMTIVGTDTPVITDPEICEYYAEIAFAADEVTDNNTTTTAVVRVVVSDYPTVADLAGEYEDGIKLTWSDPDMSTLPQVTTTETFENYESFIINNIGDWGVYDGDGERTVVLASQVTGMLEYPHIGEAMAWQVFDPDEAGVVLAAWYARSGKKMIVSFQASNSEGRELVSNDWLISPELSGNEQVISFYARSGMSSYSPELFDFMISFDGNNPTEFETFDIDREVPYDAEDWTEFTFRVPAGTRYFAIVHKSYNKVAMLVDDITYVPAGSVPVQLDLQGFNVYRDNVRINTEPVADTEYFDADVDKGKDYTYAVSAVWDKGESALSEPVTIKAESAVEGVGSYELTITPLTGAIRIEGGVGENVAIYNTAGVCVAIVKAQGVVDVPVASGIYLVQAPGAAAKVAVR